jgi:hypothetical protein
MSKKRDKPLMSKPEPARYSEPGTHVPPARPKLPFSPDTALKELRRAVAASRKDVLKEKAQTLKVQALSESQT